MMRMGKQGPSGIHWTDRTWNPTTGCSKVSEGCANCYAERMAKRLQAMGCAKYRNGFKVTLHPETLEEPLHWKKPQRVFVDSMGDLFHEAVPTGFVHSAFDAIRRANRHVFQVLTKRAIRMSGFAADDWPVNLWAGVTVEDAQTQERVNYLRLIPAPVRFLSLEPLLGPMGDLNLEDIHWIICGGESGPGARPMKMEWVREIRDKCIGAGVPFFFKQWGGVRRCERGRVLDGRTWDEMPHQA